MRSSNDMGYIILSNEIEVLGIESNFSPGYKAGKLSKLVRDMPTILNYDPKFAAGQHHCNT